MFRKPYYQLSFITIWRVQYYDPCKVDMTERLCWFGCCEKQRQRTLPRKHCQVSWNVHTRICSTIFELLELSWEALCFPLTLQTLFQMLSAESRCSFRSWLMVFTLPGGFHFLWDGASLRPRINEFSIYVSLSDGQFQIFTAMLNFSTDKYVLSFAHTDQTNKTYHFEPR